MYGKKVLRGSGGGAPSEKIGIYGEEKLLILYRSMWHMISKSKIFLNKGGVILGGFIRRSSVNT